MKAQTYHAILDLHGHLASAELALSSLGYTNSDGVWRHAHATALFVGDFADRGPDPFGVYDLVAAMVAAGSAHAVIGNHDFSFAAIKTEKPGKPGRFLRSRSEKHLAQARSTLVQAERDPNRAGDIIAWIRRTPILIETPDFRLVHACPHTDALDRLSDTLTPLRTLGLDDHTFASLAAYEGLGDDRSLLLSGPEYDLPPGQSYVDADGHERMQDRVRWWEDASYAGPAPTFFGHYALKDGPRVFAPSNSVCVDAGCGKGGPLAVYIHQTGAALSHDNFVFFPQL